MDKIYKLDVENRSRIREIISNNNTIHQKKIEFKPIKKQYVKDYCINENMTVTFTNSVVVTVNFLQNHITKDEYIDIILNNFVFHRDENNPTVLDLLDLCLLRNLLKKQHILNFYKRDNLNKLLNRNVNVNSLLFDRVFL